jgi:predicted AlkP superfamily pyrophosphatase or phosphodiesterase
MVFVRSCFLFICLWIVSFVHAQDTIQKIVAGRRNSPAQQQKPYVILISADGFRYDFAKKYRAVNLLRLGSQGVAAAYMQSSYPSLTYPNHYTIATGLYPAHHGLVDNSFYDGQKKEKYTMSNRSMVEDGSWYRGVPLWVLAEQQQMLTASFYWVGTEAGIGGVRPTYYYIYNEAIPIDRRIQVVKEWLQLPEAVRPHFITFYLFQVDHTAHEYGPGSGKTGEAVRFVDTVINKLVKVVDSLHLPVNFIFVSDHGMAAVDSRKTVAMPAAIDTTKFILSSGEALAHLYARDRQYILPAYQALKKQAVNYDVYLTNETPVYWHYREKDDWYNRLGDIILVARLPGYLNFSGRKTSSRGKHGFDPTIPDMHASFYAWGPAFKPHQKIKGFENVHIYPLITQILGLPYSHTIDGKPEVLQSILK